MRYATANDHEHGYLGDEHDGAPYCPVDDCSWNRPPAATEPAAPGHAAGTRVAVTVDRSR